MPTSLAKHLLRWYDRHARRLPWRDRPDSYRVWVSEIMLQQTRVETVLPYFERWMARFPTLADLARASEQEVLSTWEGLGYYSRARHLHQAARRVMEQHGGELPRDPAELRRLPGIGPYSAAAIASIAFGADLPALDGNIRRVLARLFEVRLPVRSPAGQRRLLELASEHLPAGRAGDFNQALMDLGAQICTPRRPDCPACPLRHFCRAYALDAQTELPVLKPRPLQPHYTVAAAVIHRDGKVLIAQRPSSGLLGGLWEFPGGKLEAGETLVAGLQREIHEELGVDVQVGEQLGIYRHAFTHFRITLHAFHCSLPSGEPVRREHADLRWVTPPELPGYPMGKIDRLIAQAIDVASPEEIE